MLFVAGSADDVAGYEKGTKAIYQAAVNADRYLLTFVNANHNAARADSGAGRNIRGGRGRANQRRSPTTRTRCGTPCA